MEFNAQSVARLDLFLEKAPLNAAVLLKICHCYQLKLHRTIREAALPTGSIKCEKDLLHSVDAIVFGPLDTSSEREVYEVAIQTYTLAAAMQEYTAPKAQPTAPTKQTTTPVTGGPSDIFRF